MSLFKPEYLAHWGVEFKKDGEPVAFAEFDSDAKELILEDGSVLKVEGLDAPELERFLIHHGP